LRTKLAARSLASLSPLRSIRASGGVSTSDPAVTAVMAYVLFGERLDRVAIAGMVACAAAVFLVNRRARV